MFVASIPYVFSYNALFSALQLSVLFIAIFALVYTSTPAPHLNWNGKHEENVYAFLRAAWLGRESLWRVFWPFFMLVNGIFYYIDYRVVNISFTIASWKTVHGMLALPLVWWITALWCCSSNTRHKLFAVSARAAAIYLLIAYLMRLYLAVEFPRDLFDCKLLIIEYGDC